MQRHWWSGLAICLGLVGCAAAPSTSDPAPAASTVAPTGLTCAPGQRVCVRCNGSGTFCALRCPECAPLLAPAADSLALVSTADRCDSLL